ncbi:MAG: non-canonical purine NTP pyrophosphatase [Pirellulaceae bacterium]
MNPTATIISPSQRLILGTHNKKKCGELRQLLAPLGYELQSLDEIADAIEVDETGTTFIENARLKATQQALHLKAWTIGEDSGLCVPVLGGALRRAECALFSPERHGRSKQREIAAGTGRFPRRPASSVLHMHDRSV